MYVVIPVVCIDCSKEQKILCVVVDWIRRGSGMGPLGAFVNTVTDFFFPEDGVGLVPKRGCLLTLAYYAFPRWYEFGERRWNDILTRETRRTRRKPVAVPLCPLQIRWLTTWAMARPNWYFGSFISWATVRFQEGLCLVMTIHTNIVRAREM
jgi:hypothetical protein